MSGFRIFSPDVELAWLGLGGCGGGAAVGGAPSSPMSRVSGRGTSASLLEGCEFRSLARIARGQMDRVFIAFSSH